MPTVDLVLTLTNMYLSLMAGRTVLSYLMDTIIIFPQSES